MLIDWFTVGAQTLNFLILVWLLKRFLYQPVLNAIDAREHRVASDLASARKKEMDAEQARDLFQQKNESFERQRNELLQEAKMAAGAERLRLLSAARLEAEELTGKRKAALQRELQELSTEICARTGQEVLDITRQALNGLAGVSLEIRMTEKLLEQLQQPDAETMRILGGIRSTTDPLTIRSAFPLTIPQQTAMQNALNQCIGA
jgi:F-type H+-transporting ATPase subunit b